MSHTAVSSAIINLALTAHKLSHTSQQAASVLLEPEISRPTTVKLHKLFNGELLPRHTLTEPRKPEGEKKSKRSL
jgi:hypothetical protein